MTKIRVKYHGANVKIIIDICKFMDLKMQLTNLKYNLQTHAVHNLQF